jgi:ABC-type branched-subunit amino acid transport system substrate-binding protein
MTARARWWRSAGAVVAVLAAACGSTANQGTEQVIGGSGTGGGSAAGDTASGAPGATTAAGSSGTGAAAGTRGAGAGGSVGDGGTGPGGGGSAADGESIEIGWVLTGVGQADDLGFSFGNTYSEQEMVEAVAAHYNANGGIGGHPIEMVFASTDTNSASWDADFAAACATFTQDHSVAAVLGYVFTQIDPLELCLHEHSIPHLSTSFDAPDNALANRYPLLFNLVQPTQEVRHVAKVDGALASGVLGRGDRVGVITGTCPDDRRAWNGTVRPHMESQGLVITEFQSNCPAGSADAQSGASTIGSIILQFRSAGVTHVMAVGKSEIALAFVALAAESQGWRPTYVTGSGPAALTGFVPEEQLRNFHAYGWDAARDVLSAQWPAPPPAVQRCLDLFAGQGIVAQSAADQGFFINACEPFFLYEAALAANGGNTEGYAVAAAIEGLGTSFSSAMLLEGRSRYGPGVHQAPVIYRHVAWDDGCGCFMYQSEEWAFP